MPPNDALPDGTDAPKKSKMKKVIILILIFLILLAAGGGGAYWWFFMRSPAGAADETETAQTASTQESAQESQGVEDGEGSARIERQSNLPRSTGHVLPLPPFVVNLSDAAGKRYLRLGMEIEVNKDVSQAIQTQSAKIRDAVIILLAGKTFADISSAEGKIWLKAEVASRLNQILGGAFVVRVYFTEFVVEQ